MESINMRNFAFSVFVLAIGAGFPVLAQSAETPMQMASRIDACEGRDILSAQITDDNRLAVTCGKAMGTHSPVLSSQNQDTGLGGAMLAGVIVGTLALITGTSSSSDTQ